uniref:Secreted protein n=1 Tax=Heterorhabditis bacteriophora TaxID=37862 RepID=A0A1I7X1E9_HETBA
MYCPHYSFLSTSLFLTWYSSFNQFTISHWMPSEGDTIGGITSAALQRVSSASRRRKFTEHNDKLDFNRKHKNNSN